METQVQATESEEVLLFCFVQIKMDFLAAEEISQRREEIEDLERKRSEDIRLSI